jgi:hypothetical protein
VGLVKLFVAVPSHSRSVQFPCAKSLLAAQQLALERGGTFRFHGESGAEIDIVRNLIAAHFLRSDADMLLMLDADQGVAADVLAAMIDLDKPVVGCIYPRRAFHWRGVEPDAAKDLSQLLYRAYRFVGFLEEDENGRATIINGFAKADHVGTGIFLVRRAAFETLKTQYPELKGKGFNPQQLADCGDDGRWGFFNRIEQEDGAPISEDISFCRRWRQGGGEIWAAVTADTTHVGIHEFHGNYLDFLKALESS